MKHCLKWLAVTLIGMLQDQLIEVLLRNLAPVRGAPLMELHAVGARVKDLSPLVESPLSSGGCWTKAH